MLYKTMIYLKEDKNNSYLFLNINHIAIFAKKIIKILICSYNIKNKYMKIEFLGGIKNEKI